MGIEGGNLLLFCGRWRTVTVTIKLRRKRQSARQAKSQRKPSQRAFLPAVHAGREHSKANLPCCRGRSALTQKRKGGHCLAALPFTCTAVLLYCAAGRLRGAARCAGFSGAGGAPLMSVIIFGFCVYESKVAS